MFSRAAGPGLRCISPHRIIKLKRHKFVVDGWNKFPLLLTVLKVRKDAVPKYSFLHVNELLQSRRVVIQSKHKQSRNVVIPLIGCFLKVIDIM